MANSKYDELSKWGKIRFWLMIGFIFVVSIFIILPVFAGACGNFLTMNRNMEKTVHQEDQSLKEELFDAREDLEMSLKAKKQ